MPACPASLKGSWIESSLNNYANDGTLARVKSLIDIAVAFKTSRNVPVFCGEFGVYIPNSNHSDRVYWYGEVRKYLEEKGIPWTIWDYTGGFGIFKKGTDEHFDYHLNTELLQALNLNVPPQKELIIRADSAGFPVYTDFVEKDFSGGGSGSVIDFYHDTKPNNGKYSLYWANAAQYSNFGFSFKTDKDLSRLVNENYALDFMIRGNSPGARFDIRFIDSKTDDPADHPWRMRITVDNSLASWDRYWHHLHIPLSSFKEQGSWDNNTWYNPEGKFDWKAVDRLEIVAEHEALTGKIFWFDNIHITNKDTASVRENGIISSIGRAYDNHSITVYPNPMNEFLNINYTLKTLDRVRIEVFSITGKMVFSNVIKNQTAGNHHFIWDGADQRGTSLPSGFYVLQFTIGNSVNSYKISVNR
jgi:endoglucanase